MVNRKQHFGLQGEELAAEHLKKNGYKIIERNFRTHAGEIDIIAKHKGQIVFTEVKTRKTNRYGHPKLAVTDHKQRKISMVALAYLKRHYTLETSARFDVVTIQSSDDGPTIEIFPNAFELAYG
ncbi:MAG: YraN family protein [Desulfobacteraceae bacterium]|jgi:putative endonuclease